MKRILIITLFALLTIVAPANAITLKSSATQGTEKTSLADTYSVVKFFKEYEYATNNYNHNTINEIYAPDYLSSDGFNKKILMDVVKDTWKTYPGIRYTVKLNSVNVYNDIAIADVTEIAKGYSKAENNKVGEFVSTMQTIYYLKRKENSWQITKDTTIKEHIYVFWGDAKNAKLSLELPIQLGAGEEYTAKLNLSMPSGLIAIGSITSDKITYPQKPSKEIFRKFSSDGTIERILKTNTDNVNEFVVATVGFSRPKISSNQTLDIKLTGYASVMERINVIPTNKFIEVRDESKK